MRYIITAVIFIATVATIIFSTSFVSDFSESMAELSNSVLYCIEKDDVLSAEKKISQMNDKMTECEGIIMMFTDHALTEELKKRISSAMIFAKNKESPLAASEIAKARELIQDMSAETQLSLSNIF